MRGRETPRSNVEEVDPGEDVAKSDAESVRDADRAGEPAPKLEDLGTERCEGSVGPSAVDDLDQVLGVIDMGDPDLGEPVPEREIGRASCRERVS